LGPEILLNGSMDRAPSNSELAALLERIDASLTRLEARLTQIESGAPALLGIVVDALDDAADALGARGLDPSQRAHKLFELAERVSRPGVSQRLSRWLEWSEEQPALDTALLELASAALCALEAVRQQGADKLGLLAVLRALSDAGVQRALGFGLSFLRRFGAHLEPAPARASLPRAAQRDRGLHT
jgi:uncharacterized protein YjgD (DUF1641 family)